MKAEDTILNPNEWVSKYSDELFSYAMYKTGKQELAEDLVQDTFLAGLKGIDTYKTLSSEKTWLFSILKHKIADHYRKASTRFEFSDTKLSSKDSDTSFLSSFFNEDGEWLENSVPHKWGSDNSLPIEEKEFQNVLSGCLGKLPENWHEVVKQKFIDENDAKEICKELNLTATNYWVIIHRAKLVLRKCLEINWVK